MMMHFPQERRDQITFGSASVVCNSDGSIAITFPDNASSTNGVQLGGDGYPGTGRGAFNVWHTSDLSNNTVENNGIWVVHYADPTAAYAGTFAGVDSTAAVPTGDANNFTSATTGLYGVSGAVVHGGTGTITWAEGTVGFINNATTGVITNAAAVRGLNVANGGGGTVTNAYGFYGDRQTVGSTLNVGIYTAGGSTWGLWVDADNVRFDENLFIGDTADANLTGPGICVNQGGSDGSIMDFKSSDVAHGMTDFAETDTWGTFAKYHATNGGCSYSGWSGGAVGLVMNGFYTTDTTTKATTSAGAFMVETYKKSGTNVTAPGSDANLMVITAAGTTRFIFDAEGSGHADVEWVTYDTYDDLDLISTMERTLLSVEAWDQTERRHLLERAGVIGAGSWHLEAGRPRAMVNFTRLAMLHHGALIQVGAAINELNERLARLEAA